MYNNHEDQHIYNHDKPLITTPIKKKKIQLQNLETSSNLDFVSSPQSTFNSPLVRSRNIGDRYIDTPCKNNEYRQSSQILVDSLKSDDLKNIEKDFLSLELSSSRKSSDVLKLLPESSNSSQSHSIFNTPDILDKILFFTFNHEDPLSLPPVYSKEYDTNHIIGVNKLFYSLGLKYKQNKLVIKNYKQLQAFNDYYRYKNKEFWLSPKTVIINFGSDQVFKKQLQQQNKVILFNELNINCNNIVHLEIRSNRYIKTLPMNLNNLDKLKIIKLPGMCGLSSESFKQLINAKNVSNLIELDLRNCYTINEHQIYKCLTNAYDLKHLNLNRKLLYSPAQNENTFDKDKFDHFKSNFSLSDNILHALQMSKPKLETFAMSGSKITEYSVWQMIAQTPSVRMNLKRISLNECLNLQGNFFKIFKSNILPNLQVLELKYFDHIENMDMIAKRLFEFRLSQELKHYKPLSLVLNNNLSKCVQDYQTDYNNHVGNLVVKDFMDWVNREDKDKRFI